MAGAVHRQPSMHNAISNSQRGRDKPVSVRGYRRILAQVQRQFGEHSALDFVKVLILFWRGSEMPREITVTSMVRPRWRRVASEPRLIHAHASYAAHRCLADASAEAEFPDSECVRHGPRPPSPAVCPDLPPLVPIQRRVVQIVARLTAYAGAARQSRRPFALALLRARRERPRSCAADECDELAPLHSITSSARASSVGGTVRPSVLAVLRLITKSYLVG